MNSGVNVIRVMHITVLKRSDSEQPNSMNVRTIVGS